MALKYAILGYLSSAPGSGYDLAQQLNEGLGWFWSASHSQIYPELKRLESAGLVEGGTTTVGEKLEKRVYSITDRGRDALIEWASAEPRYRPNRDPERLQLIFSDLADLDSVRTHLQAHRQHFIDRRDRLTAMRTRIISRQHLRVERRLRELGAGAELSLLLRDLAYSGDIERAALEIAWAETALERLDEFEHSTQRVDTHVA